MDLQVDDAGNVWDVSSGRPRFVRGPSQSIQTKAPDQKLPGELRAQNLGIREKEATVPLAGPTAAANLQGQNLGNQRTAQNIGFDRAQLQLQIAKQFTSDPVVQTYRTTLPEMAKAMRASPGKQGDIDVIYSFAKVMDPGSAVREGEIQFANASASLIQRVHQYMDMVNKGKGLDPQVRKGLVHEIRNAVTEYDRSYITAYNQYAGMAKEAGFDPAKVLGPHAGDAYRGVEMNYLRANGGLKDTRDDKASAAYTQMFMRGASYDEVAQWAKDIGAQPPSRDLYEKAQAQRARGAQVGAGSVFDRTPLSGFEQVANALPIGNADIGLIKGAKHAYDRAAMGLEAGANLLPGIQSNSAQQAAAQSNQMFEGLPSDPTAETIGKLGASGILAAPFRGAVAAGAVGNMLFGDSTDAQGLAGEAVLGGVGGKVGDLAIRGISNLIAPQVSQGLRNLGAQGYRASPGQLFGRQAKNLEDRLTANPVIGPRIEDIRRQGLETANRIPANRALGHLGQSLPDNVPAGHAAVDYTGQQAGNAYDNALNGQVIGLDPTFITRLNAIGQGARLRPQEFNELADIVQREVGGAFQENGTPLGSMSGRGYKQLDERLGDLVQGFNASDDPYRRQLAGALGDVRDQMKALARRQSPGMAKGLRAADEAWADYSILRRAASANPSTGVFTPGQLRTAVRANDRSVGKGATARGNARMQDLASDMSEVIPSDMGSSGTSEREQVNKLAPWVIGSALSPIFSEPSVNLLNKTMLRPVDPVSQFVADRLRALPRGMFGPSVPLLIGSN